MATSEQRDGPAVNRCGQFRRNREKMMMKSRFGTSGVVIAIVGTLVFGRAWAADASEDAGGTRESEMGTATPDANRTPRASPSPAGSGSGDDAAVERGDSQRITPRHRSTVERGVDPREREAEEHERQQQIWTAP